MSVLVEDRGAVTIVTFNRPEASNALVMQASRFIRRRLIMRRNPMA